MTEDTIIPLQNEPIIQDIETETLTALDIGIDQIQVDDIQVAPLPSDTMDTIIIQDSNIQSYENEVEKEEDSPIVEETPQTYEELFEPDVSQTITTFVDDYIDITLPGQGWIYLGEVKETDPPIVEFSARYIDGDDTLFNFYAANEGSTILHFYKQDVLANEYLDEYLELVVSPFNTEKSLSSSTPTRAEEMFGISAEPEVNLVGSGVQIIEDSVFIPEDLLSEAQIAYDEKRYGDSIMLLDEYTSLGVDEVDRALYLYGQNYEANSEYKNIRQSLASYEKIIESFPDSVYWEDASKRIIYLERFYVNIR